MTTELFSLDGLPIVITGAAGLLGRNHCFAVAEAGGIPILLDIDAPGLSKLVGELQSAGYEAHSWVTDTTNEKMVALAAGEIREKIGPIFGIVNNVAVNPMMNESENKSGWLENLTPEQWDWEHSVSLKSAFLVAKSFTDHLLERKAGSIVNVASDLGIIAPDQRIYIDPDNPGSMTSKKPLTYSSVKFGLIGITKYLATYWSPLPIRSNALVPGSVLAGQSDNLRRQIEARVPLGRLAQPDEYKGALVFLLADASRYMTGATLVIDGGRSSW